MSGKLIQWFRRRTMWTQILIWELIFVLGVLALEILVFQVHLEILLPILTTSQKELFMSSSQQQLKSMLSSQERLLMTFINQNADQLSSLSQLIQESLRQPFKGEQELNYDYQTKVEIPEILVDTSRIYYSIMTNSFMCASNTTAFKQSEEQNQKIIQISNFMGDLGPLFHTSTFGADSLFYGAVFVDPVILYTYPCIYRDPSFPEYHPESRPWYIQAHKQYESERDTQQRIQFTPPYTYANGVTVDVSLIMPQVDNDDNFIGAWATDFQGKKFAQYLKLNNLIDYALLVTKDGILLVHNFDNKEAQFPLYIYSEEVTGYSMTDWEIIKRNNGIDINTDQSDNNCDITYQIPGQLCRYNNLLNKELYVLSVYLSKYEFYIVILSDQSELKTEIDKLNTTIVLYAQQIMQDTILYTTGILFIVTIITQTIFHIAILKPINNVISLIQQVLLPNSNYIMQITIQTVVFNIKQMQELLQAFNSLFSKFSLSQLKKTDDCRIFENFKYPKQQASRKQEYLLQDILNNGSPLTFRLADQEQFIQQ